MSDYGWESPQGKGYVSQVISELPGMQKAKERQERAFLFWQRQCSESLKAAGYHRCWGH